MRVARVAIDKIKAFSLVELVIVIVILGVISAIAIPRITRGARGAASSALRHDLGTLRAAIDHYATEHRGDLPKEAKFEKQLTTFTDESGGDAAAPDATHIYGPYVRAIPPLPASGVGAATGRQGATKVSKTPATPVAWLYDETTGIITANTGTAVDEQGNLLSDY